MDIELTKMIAEIAKPYWEMLIAETPEIVEDGMTFEDFCDEVRLEMP